ncbi:MAG: hypothetical protein GXO16_08860 [Epsilonproteobacteria bacterium]|nr:hypothetical protein [Campylobacterota bacterium]
MRGDRTLPFESLKMVLDDDNFEKVARFCAGYVVTFPRSKVVPMMIVNAYKKMRMVGVSKASAVQRLADEFGKSKRRVYAILKEAGL